MDAPQSKRISPPRPAELASAIHQIEERRAFHRAVSSGRVAPIATQPQPQPHHPLYPTAGLNMTPTASTLHPAVDTTNGHRLHSQQSTAPARSPTPNSSLKGTPAFSTFSTPLHAPPPLPVTVLPASTSGGGYVHNLPQFDGTAPSAVAQHHPMYLIPTATHASPSPPAANDTLSEANAALQVVDLNPDRTGLVASTEMSLIRLDLQQKSAEIDAKKRVIAALQADNSRLRGEVDELRHGEEVRFQHATRAMRDELIKERTLLSNAQQELSAEVTRRGAAEREALSMRDAKSSFDALSLEHKMLKATLLETQRELESATSARMLAETALASHQAQDETNVLKGKLEGVEAKCETLSKEAEELRGLLSQEQRRRGSVEEACRHTESQLRHLSEELEASQAATSRAHAEIESVKAEQTRLVERISVLQSNLGEAEERQTSLRLELQNEIDEARAEVRRRTQQLFQTESKLAEADEARRAADVRLASAEHSLQLQQEDATAMLGRLRAAHAAIEEREAELSKLTMVEHSLKQDVAQYRAQCATLQAELVQQQDELRGARGRIDALSGVEQLCAQWQERFQHAKRAQTEAEDASAADQRLASKLRERLAACEQQLEQSRGNFAKVAELERIIAAKDEALSAAKGDVRVAELREQSAQQSVASLREALHVADTKLQVELERREELERRLRVVEDTHRESFGVYGKYVALQQFLATSTSENAKAMELNAALLAEVRTLEIRNRDMEQRLDRAEPDAHRCAALDIENRKLVGECERAMARAREADLRFAEVSSNAQRTMDEALELRRRVRELEWMLRSPGRLPMTERPADVIPPTAMGLPVEQRTSPHSQQTAAQLATSGPSDGDVSPASSSSSSGGGAPSANGRMSGGSTVEAAPEAAVPSVANEAEVHALQAQLMQQDDRMHRLSRQLQATMAELSRLKASRSVSPSLRQSADDSRAAMDTIERSMELSPSTPAVILFPREPQQHPAAHPDQQQKPAGRPSGLSPVGRERSIPGAQGVSEGREIHTVGIVSPFELAQRHRSMGLRAPHPQLATSRSSNGANGAHSSPHPRTRSSPRSAKGVSPVASQQQQSVQPAVARERMSELFRKAQERALMSPGSAQKPHPTLHMEPYPQPRAGMGLPVGLPPQPPPDSTAGRGSHRSPSPSSGILSPPR